MRLAELPRVRRGTLPTPRQPAPRLSQALGVEVLELAAQLDELGVTPTRGIVATGSCGTQAGLVAGARRLGARHRIVGVTVSRPREKCVRRVRSLAAACAELLQIDAPQGEPEVLAGYIGPGYGRPSESGRSAATLAARTERLVLDPVCTAKAMAALAAQAAQDPWPVVFWHTGGGAAAAAAQELRAGGAP